MRTRFDSLQARSVEMMALLSVVCAVSVMSCHPTKSHSETSTQVDFVVPSDGGGFYVLKNSMASVREGSAPAAFRIFVDRAGAAYSVEPKVLTTLRGGEEFPLEFFAGYLSAGDSVRAELNAGAKNATLHIEPKRSGLIEVAALPLSGDPSGWFYQAGRDRPAGKVVAAGGLNIPAENEGMVRISLKKGEGTPGAVIGFQVPHSGFYALHQARVSSPAKVKVEVFAGSAMRACKTAVVSAKGASLDTEIGYLAKGETVELVFSSDDPGEPEVKLALTIAEWAPRSAPLRVARGGDGYLNVVEPSAPLKPVDVAPTRWVEVPVMAEDATQAIRQALQEAIRLQASGGGYAGVRLAKGARYVIASQLEPGSIFEFAGARQIILDGNGATLSLETKAVMRGLYTLFRTNASQQLVFADLTVDAPYRPYTVGTVREVGPLVKGNQTVTFEIPEGALDPIQDLNPSKVTAGYLYDPTVPGRLAEGAWNHYPPAPGSFLEETATPRVFTHTVTRTGGSLMAGAKWLVKNKKAGVMYLTTSGSSDITLSGIHASACGGGLVRFWNSTRVNVLGCRFEPEGDEWVASTSDGIHGRGREGVWVEDTALRGICEDMMNVYTTPLVLDSVSQESEVVLRVLQKDPKAPGGNRTKALESGGVAVGDELVFYNDREGVILGSARVAGVEGERVKLTTAIAGAKPWTAESREFTTVYNRNTVGPVFVRDSSWADSLRFGVFLKASEAVFFNNRFEGLACSAIFASNEPEWPEGPFPANIWLEGNTFRRNNFAYPSRHREFLNVDPADVSIYLRRFGKAEGGEEYRKFVTQNQYPCSNIRIIGNTFEKWRGMGVAVRNARNVLIADNEFLAPAGDDVLRATLARDPLLMRNGKGSYAAIYLDSVSGARVVNNRFAPSGEEDLEVASGENVQDLMME